MQFGIIIKQSKKKKKNCDDGAGKQKTICIMGESDLIFSRTSAWELGEKMKKMKMGGREGEKQRMSL